MKKSCADDSFDTFSDEEFEYAKQLKLVIDELQKVSCYRVPLHAELNCTVHVVTPCMCY